jgi:hypothetical protein
MTYNFCGWGPNYNVWYQPFGLGLGLGRYSYTGENIHPSQLPYYEPIPWMQTWYPVARARQVSICQPAYLMYPY